MHWRQRNVQNSMMCVQSCCFANLNLLLFCRSRCRCRSRLFKLTEKVKCRRISLELISWGPPSSFGREWQIHCRLFTSSIKREIRDFHAVVVRWRQRNVQKSVLYVQSCCFANQTYCFFDVLATSSFQARWSQCRMNRSQTVLSICQQIAIN